MGALLLDFDGVLAPLVAEPEAAALDADCAGVLARRPPGLRVAVISGRSCDDLAPRVAALRPDALAGDHGAEIRTATERWVHPDALRLLPGVLAAARSLGGRLEVKRLSAKAYAPEREVPPPPGVRYLHGRGGIDVLPAIDWDKGRAAARILQMWGEAGPAVFLGDEATDEVAFRLLRPLGVFTVRVAPEGPTAAEETLAGQGDVAGWLRRWIQAH